MPRSASRRRSGASGARSNTAIATIATARSAPVGRFAPSPTGLLHLGSLVAATGSYLDARHQGGRWLLRIDDLDTPRNQAGAEASILRTLTAFGFMPDGEPVRQSERLPQYAAALDALGRNGLLFPCGCSRREIAANLGAADEPRCVGDCRRRRLDPSRASLRVALERLRPARIGDRSGRTISFEPAVQTDLVVRRRDGIVAYHLATVVDDAAQGITDVVRGGDLLSSTGWQLGLQQALGLPTPRYLHLPVVTEPDGGKLSKSARALPLDPGAAPALLRRALELLGQPPLPVSGDLATLWREAIARWDPGAASRQPEVRA